MEDAERIVREEISRRLKASQLAAMAGLQAEAERATAPDNVASIQS